MFPFSALRQRVRCDQTAVWLRETDRLIEEIMARAGYRSGSYFCRLFPGDKDVLLLAYRKQRGKTSP